MGKVGKAYIGIPCKIVQIEFFFSGQTAVAIVQLSIDIVLNSL